MVIGAAICLILFGQVVSRYAGASLGWSEEVSRHLLVAITFLGGTVAYKRASFIGLQGFGYHLGRRRARYRGPLQLLTLACFVVITWFGALYTVTAAEHTTASSISHVDSLCGDPFVGRYLRAPVLADMGRTLQRKTP